METKPPSRTLSRIGVLGLVLTLAFATWWGPVSASRLEDRVEAAASKALKDGGFAWASAHVEGQRVDLSGAAPDSAARDSARAAVLTSLGQGGVLRGGVTKVTDHKVQVGTPGSAFAWAALKEAGTVALEGVADSRKSQTEIERSARLLFGSKVTSRMSVAQGMPRGADWRLGANLGLKALQHLERGSASLSDNRLTVSGFAARDEDVKDIDTILEPARTAGFTVETDIQGPAEWTAVLSDGALTFSGRVPDELVQRELARAAGAGVRISDQTRVSGGAAPWSARAAAALPGLRRLSRGEITVQGKVFRIAGEGPGSAIQYIKEDMGRIQDGYSVRYALREIAPQIAEIQGVNLEASGEQKEISCQTAFERIMGANEILFGSGDARISRESGDTLDKIVEVARRCSEFRLAVEGHTDSDGSTAANARLSQARAKAVMDYMTAQGLPAAQMSSTGFGEARPVASNATRAGKARNRRIEFKVSAETN